VIIEDWRCDYNANRPHSAHGELNPAEFALPSTLTTVDQQPGYRSTGPPNGSPSSCRALSWYRWRRPGPQRRHDDAVRRGVCLLDGRNAVAGVHLRPG
jgi:hypothetical protein